MRKRVAVIFGGCSSEHEISLKSAEAVLNHLDESKYEVIPIWISPEGQWAWYRGENNLIPAFLSPNRMDRGLVYFEDGIHILPLDCVLPILHGRNGEDGTVLGLCQLAGIPLAGCGLLSSAICLHKHIAHQLVKAEGIEVPESILLRKDEKQSKGIWMERIRPLGFPVFVKPVREGSSVGMSRVEREEELIPAIIEAFSYDDEVVVEQAVKGFEVGCAIVGGEELQIGTVDEVELQSGWLDFQEKYEIRQKATIHVPARISDETALRIQETALRIFRTLRCRGVARVDMFLTPEGRIVFNEVNTLPGLTEHSRYPKMLAEAGIGFSEMLDVMIEEAR